MQLVKPLSVLLAVGAMGVAGHSTAQVPPPGPAGPVVVITGMSITPQAPPVGTYYTVTATIYSRHVRSLEIRGGIQVPAQDIVVSNPSPQTIIGPGGTVTFSWSVYCGVDGGLVQVKVDPVRELR